MQEGTLALMQLVKTIAALERAARRRPALHLRPRRPDDRRRLRLVRRPRRREHRRAQRPHRVRRGARLGGDDRRGAAAGLPAGRVPVRARVRRPDRHPGRASRRAGRDPRRARSAPAAANGAPGACAVVDRLLGRTKDSATPAVDVPPPPASTRATPSGPASCWPATPAGRTRSSSWRASPTASSSSTATASSATTGRSWAASARIDGRRVVIVGHQKGADTDENIRRNFGMAQAGGLPQGDPPLRARRALRDPRRHLRGHAGRLPGRRGRGARRRRGHRPRDHGHVPDPRPDRDRHHRRGRVGRGAGDRGRRRRGRARERRLLRDQPGGLRLDPLAHVREGGRRGAGDADVRRRPAGARGHRPHRAGARRGRPCRPGRDGSSPARDDHRAAGPACRCSPPDELVAARRAALPRLRGVRRPRRARGARGRPSDRASRIACGAPWSRWASPWRGGPGARAATAGTSLRRERRSDG